MKPDLSIALVCQSLRLDGGMGRYALDLIEGLNELGIRPTVYTKKLDERVCSGLSIDPVRINCRPFPTKLRDYYFNFRVKRLIAQRSFDAVLSNIRFPGATVTFCGGTHIGYLRGLGKTPSFFDRQAIKLETQAYAESQIVVAHSKQMSREVHDDYGISEKKALTIYPPISTARFNPSPADSEEIAAFRREFKVPGNHTTFLIPAAGSPYYKGLDILQNFFARTELPVTLLVAGRPVEETPNVRCIGFRKDMERVYKLVDYTILASRYEAFGLVAVESIASGTPVVLSQTVYANEIIAPEAKILFDNADPKSLGKALQTAVSRRMRIADVGKMIAPKYTPREHAEKVLAAIHLR